MDIKRVFLIGFIEEEVNVEQPLGLLILHIRFIFKLDKALYGLKQAPRVWYERLRIFHVSDGFVKGKINTTLFPKHVANDILILQIYIDDIIFRSANEKLCKEFESCMKKGGEMNMMEELNSFLDSRSSKGVKGSSSIKPSIQESLSRNLG